MKAKHQQILLVDIGNTHTHLGLADAHKVRRQLNVPTDGWHSGKSESLTKRFLKGTALDGISLCSVVPEVTSVVLIFLRKEQDVPIFQLGPKNVSGIGVDYPNPSQI